MKAICATLFVLSASSLNAQEGTADQVRGLVYAAPGTYVYNVPRGVTYLQVVGCGGGQGGAAAFGGHDGRTDTAAPGGSGVNPVHRLVPVKPGSDVTVHVGRGGEGGVNDSGHVGSLSIRHGSHGEDSFVANVTLPGSATCEGFGVCVPGGHRSSPGTAGHYSPGGVAGATHSGNGFTAQGGGGGGAGWEQGGDGGAAAAGGAQPHPKYSSARGGPGAPADSVRGGACSGGGGGGSGWTDGHPYWPGGNGGAGGHGRVVVIPVVTRNVSGSTPIPGGTEDNE